MMSVKKKGEVTPDLRDEVLGSASVTDQGFQKKIDRYSRAKERQGVVLNYIAGNKDLSQEFKKMSGCGGVLIFKHYKKTDFRKLSGGISCQIHLLCQLCALRRDAGFIRKYALRIEQYLLRNPNLVPVLITRTVKNGFDLLECYNHLGDIHRELIARRRQSLSQRSTARGRFANSVMQYVASSVGTYEFKRGSSSGLWHPHIHEVAFLDPVFKFMPKREPACRMGDDGKLETYSRTVYVPQKFQDLLRAEYFDISGDSYQVDVRRIDLSEVSASEKQELSFVSKDAKPDKLPLVKALCEVFKYALKYNELPVEDHLHAYRTLKGKKLIFSYGDIRKVKVPDNLVDSAVSELEIGDYEYELWKSYVTGYRFSGIMPEQDFDDMQETAAVASRRRHLEQREERLNNNELRIHTHDGRIITFDDVKSFVDENKKESFQGRKK